jgi:hypothetical protein
MSGRDTLGLVNLEISSTLTYELPCNVKILILWISNRLCL